MIDRSAALPGSKGAKFVGSTGMATSTVVTLVDDLDGSTGDVLTCFVALGETAVELDLSAEHRVELEEFLHRFLAAGRPVVPEPAAGKGASPRGRTSVDRERLARIRDWARESGLQVADRGRLKAEVVAAYDAAH